MGAFSVIKPLFAPWRMEVIEGYGKSDECVFCTIAKTEDDAKYQILKRTSKALVVMNKFPYTNGHLLIIPNRHLKDWTELNAEEISEMGKLTQLAIAALKKSL